MDVTSVGVGSRIVVAVHGIQGTRAVWRPIADELRGVATFVLPNLRGRANAKRGSGVEDYSLNGFADDLAEAIDANVARTDYWLAGWSLGVSVVLQFLARKDVARPKGIILASGTPAIREVSWFKSTDDSQLMKEIAEREQRLGLKEAADHDAVAWTWKAVRDTDQRQTLDTLDLPTLILHGTEDEDCPLAAAIQMTKRIRNAEICTIEGAGHSIPVTHPGQLAAVMGSFISSRP
jgi:pimeloyl-ACP methyl ester carboxylesterase